MRCKDCKFFDSKENVYNEPRGLCKAPEFSFWIYCPAEVGEDAVHEDFGCIGFEKEV